MFLRWDISNPFFDENIMSHQYKIEGGDLFGQFDVDVDDLTLCGMRSMGTRYRDDASLPTNQQYLEIGISVERALTPALTRFISSLKNEYGQFWLPDIKPWDKSVERVGSACVRLNMKWQDPDSRAWSDFIPTRLHDPGEYERFPPPTHYQQFLQEEDWRRLQATDWSKPQSDAAQALGRAIRLLASEDYGPAFIEASTAMDLARRAVIRSRREQKLPPPGKREGRRKDGDFAKKRREYLEIGVLPELLDNAIKADVIRDQVAHHNYAPAGSDVQYLRTLLHEVARVCGIGWLKLTSLARGNAMGAGGIRSQGSNGGGKKESP